MTLFKYIARRFLVFTLIAQMPLLLIILLLDTLPRINKFLAAGNDLDVVIWAALLSLPEGISLTFPFVLLLGGLAAFLTLTRSSELVVARASGLGAFRLLAVPVFVTLVIGALGYAVFNPVMAYSIRELESIEARYLYKRSNQFSVSADGVWLRQESDAGVTIIQAVTIDPENATLNDVVVFDFDNNQRLIDRTEADSARLEGKTWVLKNALRWDLSTQASEFIEYIRIFNERIPTEIDLEQLQTRFSRPISLSVWQLPAAIAKLSAAGLSTTAHVAYFHSKIAAPAYWALMVLIGAGFAMRNARTSNLAIMSISAVVAGFVFFALRAFADSLGAAGQMSPFIAAWAVPISGILVISGVILHLEDG